MTWLVGDTASTIAARFEHSARERAAHPAVADSGRTLSYAQLNAAANRYAAAIRERSDGVERVALLLGHGSPVLAGILATLKCAMTVVTLNPSEPSARLSGIREAAGAQLLLTDQGHHDLGVAAGFPEDRIVLVTAPDPDSEPAADAPGPDSETPDAADQPGDLDPDRVAFLLCTSGSTGAPKVVMQTNRNMLHNVLRYTNGLGIVPGDRIAWLASLSGGQGLATVWSALLNGATLCPFPVGERGVTGLAGWLQDNGVTVFDTIPSVLRSFGQTLRDQRIAGVRLVRLASEGALLSDFEIFRRHFPPDAVLASVLASSEAGVIAQAMLTPSDRPAPGRLPVGQPAEGIDVLLLDQHGAPVADGEPGELVIAGEHLSLGYRGDETLTVRRFETVDGVRRFRSGDLARRTPELGLTVVGRADKQIKIRGNRLQLEEVEAALASHPDVAAAAVLARETERGDTRLTAYVSFAPERAGEPAELRRWLSQTLPPFAIPATFEILDKLPLTPHGKVDRERLAGRDRPDPAGSAGSPPAPGWEAEEALAGVWSAAFDREVGPHERFLELGGDSLIAAVIAAGVHELYGVELDLRVFASDVTVASLAALLQARRRGPDGDQPPPLRRVQRTGPLSSSQARMWATASASADGFWNVVVPFRIRGPLDVEAFRSALERLVERHEILRTSYVEVDGSPLAVVRPPERFELDLVDLRGEPDPEAVVEQRLQAELALRFALDRDPLLRVCLLQTGPEEYRMLRTTHHLIHDALSWRTFFGELGEIYEARRRGKAEPLPELPALQYLDYAVWERVSLRPQSRAYQAELEWWERQLQPATPPLRLPFARPEPIADVAREDGVVSWGIAPELSAALDRLGRAAGATYYMTRLAVFSALLCLETGGQDIVIGSTMSTRTRAELQGMIGVFLNFAPLRLRFSGAPGLREWITEVRRVVVDTSARVAIPAEVRARELSRRKVATPRAEARFVAWATIGTISFGGLEIEPLPRRCVAGPGFRLGVNRPFEAERCWTEFDPAVYDPVAVRAFLDRLALLVSVACAEPDRSLRDLHVAMSVLA